jgi:hypothetical protein
MGIGFLYLTQVLSAQQQQPTTTTATISNPFDLSAARQAMGDDEMPTATSVAALEQQSQSLFATDCKAAIDVLDKFARESNGLANYIAQTLRPYYNAPYEKTKKVGESRLNTLVPIEKLANDYKAKRNKAMVMEAECLVKTGDRSKAASLFFQALSFISIDEEESWDRARAGLFSILQVGTQQ